MHILILLHKLYTFVYIFKLLIIRKYCAFNHCNTTIFSQCIYKRKLIFSFTNNQYALFISLAKQSSDIAGWFSDKNG